MTAINTLKDNQVLALLQQMSAANPDVSSLAGQFAQLDSTALDMDQLNQLARAVLSHLADDPQQAEVIQNLLKQPPQQQFQQINSRIPLLIALILVLGAKVEFNHNADGSQSFHFQYDGDSTAVVQLLKKIENLLPKAKQ